MRKATLCLLFVALALALRLYRLDAQSLWLDEAGTWGEVVGKTWLALLAELFSEKAAYPLYHLLLKGWVGLASDSEWALRFPSALAGAAAAAAIYLAASEAAEQRAQERGLTPSVSTMAGNVAALLLATSPYALWYAQDAKAYSLLLFVIAIELWALLRALRRRDRRSWLLLLGIAIVSLFAHRLSLLSVAGAALACALTPTTTVRSFAPAPQRQGRGGRIQGNIAFAALAALRFPVQRIQAALVGLAIAFGTAGVAGLLFGVSGESRGAGGHIAAGPLDGLWLTFTRFSLDRWWGDIPQPLGLPRPILLLPTAILALWGLAYLIRDARAGRPPAIAILCMFFTPIALLAIALTLTTVPFYEARYAIFAFPAWALVLAYPFVARQPAITEHKTTPPSFFVAGFALCALFAANAAILFQPDKGLFSGAAVKEQWRDAIGYLARRAHPDDLVVIHPYYAQPMWSYYAPRVTPDPLLPPVAFAIFKEGELDKLTEQQRYERANREFRPLFKSAVQGKKRALLLIAPEHARTIDPPSPQYPNDRYGWVGLQFEYSSEQRTWPCGGEKFVGVEVMCQSYPETPGAHAIPQPAIPLDAAFGELHLRGYTLNLAGGAARPGGTLPITLYWEAKTSPARNYRFFLHLCRDCTIPPLANDDGPPLNGYGDAGRTTTWIPGDPVHDERSLALPPDLPPGRYTLLLGVYPEGDASAEARLPVVSAAPILEKTRLILGEIIVIHP